MTKIYQSQTRMFINKGNFKAARLYLLYFVFSILLYTLTNTYTYIHLTS